MTLLNILLATLMGGVLSAVAAALVMAGLPQRWMPRLVGFATGVLLAVALLDVLPEAFEYDLPPQQLFTTMLLGLLSFYGLERISVWRHSHADEEGHDHHCPPHEHQHAHAHGHAHHGHGHGVSRNTVMAVLVGGGFHNFVDGVLLAATFLTSPELGWLTAFAVIAHEIPHEAGGFAIVRAAGYSRWRALAMNALSSLSAVIGGLLGYFALREMQTALPYVLVIAASSFLYIAISDLLPLLRSEGHRRTSMWQTAFMLIGVLLIAVGVMFEH
ncbi:ZIP family metal transporter [Uliginosibacterium sediminicola]|uniref:ZIP family metal transporter n=1 Tax=Uliginosibacterium sediminicola TaxID=2024550 RepID=A0ABU9YUG2_9RHOO